MNNTNSKKKINNIPETSSSGLSYKGEVGVSVVKNGKTRFTNKYKNTGSLSLFKFIVNCLAGKYSSANSLRPKYLTLYSVPSWWIGEDEPDRATVEDIIADSSYKVMSGSILADSTDNVTTRNTDTELSASNTAEFLVPFTLINDNANISLFVLHYSQNSANIDYSAYFILKEYKEVTCIKKEDYGNSYNLFVEWTMTIQNSN